MDRKKSEVSYTCSFFIPIVPDVGVEIKQTDLNGMPTTYSSKVMNNEEKMHCLFINYENCTIL